MHRIAFRVGKTACASMLAGVGLTALGFGAPASAQQMVYVEPPQRAYGPPPAAAEGGLPVSEILMVVRSSGLRPLTQPSRRGARYVLLASDNMGGQLRVVVSAHDGRIVHAEPAHDPRFAYYPVRPRGLIPGGPQQQAAMPSPQYAAPDLREPTPPLPPRAARTNAAPQQPAAAKQDHKLASAPDTTASIPARPATTPLPRPRPVIAANEAAAPAAPAAPATQAAPRETSPEAETAPAVARPAAAAPSAAPATKPTETQMIPVAPLD
jgi:hypothetical protein